MHPGSKTRTYSKSRYCVTHPTDSIRPAEEIQAPAMLITQDEILPRFMEHLSWATEIDLATAWATGHDGLRALQRHRPPPDVRAVLGRWGNLTDPVALRMLATIAAAIDAYAQARKNDPPPQAPRPPITLDLDPLQMLEGVTDWRSYVAALEQCDAWWSHHYSWSVLGEQGSWRETAEVLHDVVAQPNWDELDHHDCLRLLGLTRGEDWALFGRMRPPAFDTVFGADLEAIQDTVLGVVAADDNAFPQLAFESYRALRDIEGVGPGIATRLLTLARPNRFVSVNSASTAGLAASYGLAPSTLGDPSNYDRLLTAIYEQDWYRAPAPSNARERAIWRIRAALLDSFVYDTDTAD